MLARFLPFLHAAHVLFGIFLGTVVTAVWSLCTFMTTWSWWPGGIWKSSPMEWANWMCRVVIHGAFGHTFRHHGDFTPLKPGEFGVVASNHFSFIGLFGWAQYIFRISPNVVFVVKHDLNPLIRHTLRALGVTIEINRSKPKEAMEIISGAIPELVERGALFVILVDGTRPTAKKRAKQCRDYAQKIPDVEDWLKHTCMPRTGGLLRILKPLHELGVRAKLYDVTLAYDVDDEGLKDALATYGRTLHIRCDMTSTYLVPHEREALQAWLLARYKEKNARIDHWRKPNVIEAAQLTHATDAS